jgi:hypothetical protein
MTLHFEFLGKGRVCNQNRGAVNNCFIREQLCSGVQLKTFMHKLRFLRSRAHGIAALHILSKGSMGEITLGNEQVDRASLNRSAQVWRAIGTSLAVGADILLHGWDVTADGAQCTPVSTLQISSLPKCAA